MTPHRSTPGRSVRDVVEAVGVRAGAGVPVQAADGGHLLPVELEVEDAEVLLHPAAGDRLREDDVAALDVPAQRHLGGGPADLLRDPPDDRIVVDLAAR